MLIDLISKEEKDMIQALREFAMSSGHIHNEVVDVNTFLKFWERAKSSTMDKVFGEKLILKKEINIALEDDELWGKMRRLTWGKDFDGIRARLMDGILGIDKNSNEHWINPLTRMTLKQTLRDFLLSPDALVENIYDGPAASIFLPNKKEFKLAHGAKVMKALGRLVKEFIPEYMDAFERVRIAHSQIMNEAKLKANLCVSIHPLDYMTASYNDCDWRSCMCWDEGEYRRGVIEMMNSPVVICAYLESSSTKLQIDWNNNLEWNSKRWREFFIVRPEFIAGIKGYPYWNRTLENEVLKWLNELFSNAYGIQYSKKIIEYGVDEPLSDNTVGVDHVCLQMDCGPAMYNDFYSDNLYHVMLSNRAGENRRIYTDYSGESECIVCGNASIEFEDSGDLTCIDCVSYATCCKCGNRIYEEDYSYTLDGRTYCYDCYSDLPECDICEEKVDSDCEEGLEFAIAKINSADLLLCCDPFSVRNMSADDVLLTSRWEDEEDEWERDRKAVARHFCSCAECAHEIFIRGKEEFQIRHATFSNWHEYVPVVPLDHFLESGLQKLCGDSLAATLLENKDVKKSA